MSIVHAVPAVVETTRYQSPASRVVDAYLDRVSELGREARDAAYNACLEAGYPLPVPEHFADMQCQRWGWDKGVDDAAKELDAREQAEADDQEMFERDEVGEFARRRHLICGSQD